MPLRLQVNLEIAPSGVSATVKAVSTSFLIRPKVVETPDHVINSFYVIRCIVSSSSGPDQAM